MQKTNRVKWKINKGFGSFFMYQNLNMLQFNNHFDTAINRLQVKARTQTGFPRRVTYKQVTSHS